MSGVEPRLADSDAVDLYAPGLPAATTLRAALRRFFPACMLSVGVVVAFLGLPRSVDAWIAVLGGTAAVAATLTAGFFAGLAFMRRHLYPDALVDGRRSVVAGLMSPLATFLVMASGIPLGTAEALGLLAVVGVAMAVLMFFAWLTPTPEAIRDPAWAHGDSEEKGRLHPGAS